MGVFCLVRLRVFQRWDGRLRAVAAFQHKTSLRLTYFQFCMFASPGVPRCELRIQVSKHISTGAETLFQTHSSLGIVPVKLQRSNLGYLSLREMNGLHLVLVTLCMYECIYVCVYVCMCRCVYILCMYIYVCMDVKYMHIYIHINIGRLQIQIVNNSLIYNKWTVGS